MVNTDVRTLMIFEFNRVLLYISEIIEIERKEVELDKEFYRLGQEVCDWKNIIELTEKEERLVKQEIEEIYISLNNIEKERSRIEKYRNALYDLVTKTIEAIMDNETLNLKRCEIRQDMLEEYVYILCNIKINGDYMHIEDIFSEVADFVILLSNMYEEDVTYLIRDIFQGDLGEFYQYFKN